MQAEDLEQGCVRHRRRGAALADQRRPGRPHHRTITAAGPGYLTNWSAVGPQTSPPGLRADNLRANNMAEIRHVPRDGTKRVVRSQLSRRAHPAERRVHETHGSMFRLSHHVDSGSESSARKDVRRPTKTAAVTRLDWASLTTSQAVHCPCRLSLSPRPVPGRWCRAPYLLLHQSAGTRTEQLTL